MAGRNNEGGKLAAVGFFFLTRGPAREELKPLTVNPGGDILLGSRRARTCYTGRQAAGLGAGLMGALVYHGDQGYRSALGEMRNLGEVRRIVGAAENQLLIRGPREKVDPAAVEILTREEGDKRRKLPAKIEVVSLARRRKS